jgi:hypothetical protein
MVPRLAVAALALAVSLVVPFAVADHKLPKDPGQSMDGDNWIIFDHKGGNEWWVEVRVTSGDGIVHGVEARNEQGTFHRLTLRSNGNWAGSFHIPPGEKVQFHAERAGSMSNIWDSYSCLFTHPGGIESCPTGVRDDYRATYRPSGNSGWAQVYVDSNRPTAAVGMVVDDVNGGRYSSLKHESWGAWTKATSIPAGYTVQFFSGDGAEGQESPCYRWTAATTTQCPPSYGPNSPQAWMTRFDQAKVQEWWVEVKVGPVEPSVVWAQDEGSGSWVQLAKKDWGVWAGSFHVEPGHKVHYQALFPDSGNLYTSCWFSNPSGLAPDGNQICRNIEYGA